MESIPTQKTETQNPEEVKKELQDALMKDETTEVPKYGMDEKSEEDKFSDFLTKSKPEDIYKSFQEGKYSYEDIMGGKVKADPSVLKYFSKDDWMKIHGVEEKTNEPKIKVVTPIGASGRKLDEDVVQESKRFLEELNKEKELREKQKEGKLLTSEELGILKSADIMREIKLEEKREKEKSEEDLKEKIDEALEKSREFYNREKIDEKTEESVIKELSEEEKKKGYEIMPDTEEMILEEVVKITESFDKDKIEKELDKLPEKQREKIAIGLNNLGFFVEEKKNKFFAKTFGLALKGFNKKGTMGRFLTSLEENYTRDAGKTRQLMEDMKEGKMKQLSNTGYLAGNILKYGRTVADAVGYTFASPLRYVMMGGMMFSRGSEAAKEARLMNEKVIEKTRIKDIEQAENEAWKIYEEAQKKAGENEIKKEDLNKAYNENISKDLMERLKKDPEPGVASGIIEKIIKKDVERSIKNIDKKLEKIETDKKLSAQEKEIEKEKIIKKYSEHLNSLDRMVSQYGTVDNLAMAAKYMETGSKMLVKGMMVETLILSIDKLSESISGIFSHDVETAPSEASLHEVVHQTPPIEGAFESAVEVKSGDSVWKIVDRQLEGRGYFKDITGSPEEIMAKKTYIIDAIKDEIAKDPKNFGISSGDADKIVAGEKIKLGSFFEKDASNIRLGQIMERAQEISQYETTEPEFSPEVEALRAQIDSWDNEMFEEAEHADISTEQTQVDVQPELEPVHQEVLSEAPKAGITEQVVETISDKTTKATEDLKNFISSGNKGDWEKIKNMTYDQMSKNMPQFETRLNSIVAGNASKLGFDASIRDGEKIGTYVERIARSTV